jgi:hypothetical protein
VSAGEAGDESAGRGVADSDDEAEGDTGNPEGDADGAIGAGLEADPQATARPAMMASASRECEERIPKSP